MGIGERIVEKIVYSRDTRLEAIFELKKTNKKIYVYGANRAAAVRKKLLREYNIFPEGY